MDYRLLCSCGAVVWRGTTALEWLPTGSVLQDGCTRCRRKRVGIPAHRIGDLKALIFFVQRAQDDLCGLPAADHGDIGLLATLTTFIAVAVDYIVACAYGMQADPPPDLVASARLQGSMDELATGVHDIVAALRCRWGVDTTQVAIAAILAAFARPRASWEWGDPGGEKERIRALVGEGRVVDVMGRNGQTLFYALPVALYERIWSALESAMCEQRKVC